MGPSVLMLMLLVMLIALLPLQPATGHQNCTLQVSDGTEKKEILKCTEYEGSACYNGPLGGFPASLSEGKSVSRPRNFTATLFRNTIEKTEKVGLKYEWKAPADGISREHIKGFYLKMQPVGSGQVICRLFDLQDFDMTTSASLSFSYVLFPLTVSGTYLLDLFSLPPPTDNEQDEGLLASQAFYVSLPPNQNGEVFPQKWQTWVMFTKLETKAKIEVRFGFPEKGSLADRAMFDKYLIQLVKYPSTVAYNTTYIRKFSHENSEESEGVYEFTDVQSGRYRVQIQPMDSTEGSCQCGADEFWGRSCGSCSVTHTGFFNFTRVPPTTSLSPKTEAPTTSESRVGESRSTKTDADADLILPTVLVAGAFLVLAVLVLVIYCWRNPTCAAKTYKKDDDKGNNKRHFSDVFRKIEQFPHHTTREMKVPEISRKSVLLLASEDHKYFSQALHSFAAFLSLHCQCDVMFAPQQLSDVRKTANSYCWLSGKIDQADVVIIVTSEAACRLYRAFQNGQLYKEADLGPEGDLFTPGIQHICGKIANGEDVSKVMMVRFDHTCTSQCLPVSALPPSLYPLPARLRSFLLHLHGLDDNTMDLSRVNLPLQGNVEELEGGKEWLDAVQDSISFEREHPQWFEEMFGTPVPRNNVGRLVHASPVNAQNSEELNPLQRRLSSVSTHANKDHYRCQTTSQDVGENPSVFHTESEFLPPSVFDANSAHTVPFSDFTVSEPPLEIDEGVSRLLRMVNAQYEQEQLKEGRGREQWEGHGSVSSNEQDSVQDEHTTRSWKVPSTVPGCNNVEVQFYDENYDCISVSSAQSV